MNIFFPTIGEKLACNLPGLLLRLIPPSQVDTSFRISPVRSKVQVPLKETLHLNALYI